MIPEDPDPSRSAFLGLRVRPVHFAALALNLFFLLTPVSQLAPRGALGKVPMAVEAAILVVLLGRWALSGFHPGPTAPLLWLGLAILHAMASALWAFDAEICLRYGIRALHWALWAYALFAVIATRRDLIALLRGLHGAAFVAASVGIVQGLFPTLQADFTKENTEGAEGAALVWESEVRSGSIVRVTGTLAHPLGLALLLNFTLPWTPVLLRAAATRTGKGLVVLSAAAQLLALGLTYSRMAVLALALSLVLYVLRGGVRRRAATLSLIALAATFSLPFLPDTMIERLFDPTHFRESESLVGRLEMQVYGSDLGQKHGLFGVGYGCYGPAYEAAALGSYVEQARWLSEHADFTGYDYGAIGAHNTWLEVWVEQGVLGLALLFTVLGLLAAGLLRTNARLERGSPGRDLGLGLEACFAALLFSTVVLHCQEFPIAWIFIGLCAAWLRLERERRPAAP